MIVFNPQAGRASGEQVLSAWDRAGVQPVLSSQERLPSHLTPVTSLPCMSESSTPHTTRDSVGV